MTTVAVVDPSGFRLGVGVLQTLGCLVFSTCWLWNIVSMYKREGNATDARLIEWRMHLSMSMVGLFFVYWVIIFSAIMSSQFLGAVGLLAGKRSIAGVNEVLSADCGVLTRSTLTFGISAAVELMLRSAYELLKIKRAASKEVTGVAQRP